MPCEWGQSPSEHDKNLHFWLSRRQYKKKFNFWESLGGRTLHQLSCRPRGSSVCRRDFAAAGTFSYTWSILEKEKRRVSKPLCQQGEQCNYSCEHTLPAWGVWYTLVNTCWQIYKEVCQVSPLQMHRNLCPKFFWKQKVQSFCYWSWTVPQAALVESNSNSPKICLSQAC
jgi:hypothetical protein